MKKQGIIELLIGLVGIAIIFITQQIQWSSIPIILFGIISIVMIRKADTAQPEQENICMKKRNILSVILLPIFAIICYFSANEIIRNDFLWIMLTTYLFLAAHGIMFMAPINAFGNERK